MYSVETYKFAEKRFLSWRYKDLTAYGKTIAGLKLYDAARAQWKGSWRLPTKTEFQELCEKCIWRWTTQGHHQGYHITGPNGNSIFLSAAGFRLNEKLFIDCSHCYYWSGTKDENYSNNAHNFYSDSSNLTWDKSSNRYYGFSVRPVTE
jgi:hypothetical protein